MDECTLRVKRGSEHLRISARHEQGHWILEMNVTPSSIETLPEGFPVEVTRLKQSKHLEGFAIRTAGIRTIPQEIRNMVNITKLRLVNGDLEGFPLAVCHLQNLTVLSLRNNGNIKKLPEGVCGKLKRLTELRMNACGLTCLPDDLYELDNLEELNLSRNRLTHLCDGFKKMTKLTHVWLQENPFVCLDEEFPFDALDNIEELYMSKTNMKTLPGGIGQLVKLNWITLDGNKLEHLPREFCNLRFDVEVFLKNNPLSKPPLSVCRGGMSSIKSYFQDLEGSGAVKSSRRTKLIILGKSGSGKSSLIRAIQYSLEGREQNACVQREDRTIGIDQHDVSLKDVDLVVLDSGGHRSYSPISQLFTSNSCLVIITADAEQYQEKADVAFDHLIEPYFQRVYDYVNTAVILPVVTKADLVPSKQFQQISTDLVRKALKYKKEREELMETCRQTNRQKITIICKDKKRPQKRHENSCIERIFFTSAKTCLNTGKFIEYINGLLKDRSLFPGLDSLLPSSWVKSEEQLQFLGKERSPPTCSQIAATEAIIPCGVSPDNAPSLFSYLHTVGSICHYDQYSSLRQYVFLQPKFLINLLKAVYHHDLKSALIMDKIPQVKRRQVIRRDLEEMLTKLSENGIASMKLLDLIWSQFGLEKESNNLMLKLLICFNFAYVRCDNDSVIDTVNNLVKGDLDKDFDDLFGLLEIHNGEVLLPWFLPDKQPEGLLTVCPSDESVNVCVIYCFSGSIPEGLFHRLSARCHRHSNATNHWLSGVQMTYAGITAVLKCDKERAEIVLSASIADSLNAYARLWLVVWRFIVDIENEIKQAPGAIYVVQRYFQTRQEEDLCSVQLGVRRSQVHLSEKYPTFQMNEEDLVARRLEEHKSAVINAESFIHMPLKSLLSVDSGKFVTETDAGNIAFHIEDAKALLKLRFTLKVKKEDITASSEVCYEALDVINKWRQSSSYACVSVLRDALHKTRLTEVDKIVFGHIRDITLLKPQHVPEFLSMSAISDVRNSRETGLNQDKHARGGDTQSPSALCSTLQGSKGTPIRDRNGWSDLQTYSHSDRAFLAGHSWQYDVFICHTGDDKQFVDILYDEMVKCNLKAFFDKKSLMMGQPVQATIAEAIINSPFFLVVLSHSFPNEGYPEAELKAALAFHGEYKKTIIPVFYKMSADECHHLKRRMYRQLCDTTGVEREMKSDQQFAESICQGLREEARKELHSRTVKVWKPKGRVWKPIGKDGLEVLQKLTEDLKAEQKKSTEKTADSLSDHCQDVTSTNQQRGTTALPLPSSVQSAGQSSATPQSEVVHSEMSKNHKESVSVVEYTQSSSQMGEDVEESVPLDSGDGAGEVTKESLASSMILKCESTNKLSTKGMLSENRVFQAVLKYGATQWSNIGGAIGLTDPQIQSCTVDKVSPGSKLEALIGLKVDTCGIKEAEKCLLTASGRLPHPIIDSVLKYVSGGGHLFFLEDYYT